LDYKSGLFYDLDGKLISSNKDFVSTLKPIVQLNLLKRDCMAYKSGIIDGDMLVQYGNWKYNQHEDYSFLQSEMQRLEDSEKPIKVIRFNPKEKLYKIIPFKLPKDMAGVNVELVYLTASEWERIMNTEID